MRSFPYSPNYTFVLEFEENFDIPGHQEWMRRHWTLSIFFGVLYVAFIFALKKWMENRPPYEIRQLLVLWNAVLAVFSITAAYRTVPELLHVLTHYGYHFSVCNRSYMVTNPVTSCWAFFFVLSKVPELGDTLFVVLRKQKLIFLHWFHHFLTLIVSWYVFDEHPGMARWVVVMNYSVHAVMYSYYALRALKFKIPRSLAMCITVSQIFQMFLGFFASVYSLAMIYAEKQCHVSKGNALAFFFLYACFLALFVNFFIKSYFFPPKSRPDNIKNK